MISSYVCWKTLRIEATHQDPPPTLLPILAKTKAAYLLWFEHYRLLRKSHRHTLGERIDRLLIELIESIAASVFAQRTEKIPYVLIAVRKLDTLKVLLLVLWETKSLDNRKYIALSERINEVGRILGGWYGQLQKQNSPEMPGKK